jgi:RHS repeat-associated protein
MTFPNGQQRLFTYDNQDRLTNITNTSPGGGTVASFDYAYDYDWQAGGYSMRGQRTSVSVTAPGAPNLVTGLTKYSYDASYQLVRADYPNNTYDAWTYDAIGNRLSRRVPGGGYTLPYTYYTNAAGGNTQRLRNDSSYDFTYDAAGNVTAASAPGISNAYVWDYANRLTSYGGKTYTYDAFGRASVAASGSTTRYIGLKGNAVSERNTTAGVANDYLFGPGTDEPLAKRTANGSVTYYGADGLGSIVVTTDPTGAVLNSTGFSPWGETVIAPPELFGYTGRETGGPSWYYRARHYDAAHGRFLSEDPLQFMMGPNFYAYVHNNPIIIKDPFGFADLVPFPGNPKPPPPFPNCWPDVREFDEPPFDQRPTGIGDAGRTAGRAAVTIALAAANIVIWNCVVAEAYCASQSDYCDCMQYAHPSGYCKDIFGGCRNPHRPRNAPSPLPCGTCPISH